MLTNLTKFTFALAMPSLRQYSGVLFKSHNVFRKRTSPLFCPMSGILSMKFSSGDEESSGNKSVRNYDIKESEMRVVYIDEVTQKSEWKIMQRAEALKFAQSMYMDLVLGIKLNFHFYYILY